MAGRPFDSRRRSSVVMYDPARDVFTATEDTIVEPDETPEPTLRSPDQQEKRDLKVKHDSSPPIDGQQISGSASSRGLVSLELSLAPCGLNKV
jgi:hypothetical protein